MRAGVLLTVLGSQPLQRVNERKGLLSSVDLAGYSLSVENRSHSETARYLASRDRLRDELPIRGRLVRIRAVNHFVTGQQNSDDCAHHETDNRADPGRSAFTNRLNTKALR